MTFFIKNKNTRNSFFAQKKNMQTRVNAGPHHGYHLVDPSPWPALTALCMLWLTVSLVLFFHQYSGAGTILT
jgi:hypothetical protein